VDKGEVGRRGGGGFVGFFSLSVKMDRENSLTLLCPEWGSNIIPSDPQSEPLIDCATGSGKRINIYTKF
jgi:hypothetical protein